MEFNDLSTTRGESSDSESSSRDGIDASSPDDGALISTAARTGARQLEAHMSGQSDGEAIREGRTRAKIGALNQEAAAGLISMIGPCDGSRIFLARLAAQVTGGEANKLPLTCQGGGTGTDVVLRGVFIKAFGRLDGGNPNGI